jgi:hypothetical protein
MIDEENKALERLSLLASKAKINGLDIDKIVETVIGPDYDSEFELFVRIALESNKNEMTLQEIVSGILKLRDWQIALT